MGFCIVCGIATDRCNTIGSRRLEMEGEIMLSIVRQWIAPKTASESDIICHSCYNAANSVANDDERPEAEEAPLGHRRVCTLCGRSLLRRIRYHPLRIGSAQDRKIIEVVKEWIIPRAMSVSTFLCHSCWMRASRASRHFHSGPSTSAASSVPVNEPSSGGSLNIQDSPAPLQQSQSARRPHVNTIVLPEYFRPVETQNRCFVEGCCGSERNRVTPSMRRQLLKMYNYYVPPNNRLCDYHLTCTSSDFLNDISMNIINVFNADHIQDMLTLKDAEVNFLDFEDFEIDSSLNGKDAIIQYYCNCIVGKRTVGCCAHIISIICKFVNSISC
ncbi:uncharacterized protein LOC106141527 [Amyelois transitella]|uniref:uncharacterized protein LOC106141527 n=1 Tax=Amyelois transitella TaxID=680683 RepID=UPI0029902BCF|nr:uncharacterized protein LOC106141527 [Amyelois transitella]